MTQSFFEGMIKKIPKSDSFDKFTLPFLLELYT